MSIQYAKENKWKMQNIKPEYGDTPKYVVSLNMIKLFRERQIEGTDKSYTEEVDAIWRITNPEAKDDAEVKIAEVKILTGEERGQEFYNVLLQKSQTEIFNHAYKMSFNGLTSEWIVAGDIQFASGDYGCAIPQVVDVAILNAQVLDNNNENKNKAMGITRKKEDELDPYIIKYQQWNDEPDMIR